MAENGDIKDNQIRLQAAAVRIWVLARHDHERAVAPSRWRRVHRRLKSRVCTGPRCAHNCRLLLVCFKIRRPEDAGVRDNCMGSLGNFRKARREQAGRHLTNHQTNEFWHLK